MNDLMTMMLRLVMMVVTMIIFFVFFPFLIHPLIALLTLPVSMITSLTTSVEQVHVHLPAIDWWFALRAYLGIGGGYAGAWLVRYVTDTDPDVVEYNTLGELAAVTGNVIAWPLNVFIVRRRW